jgi:glycosyltransferase involved in cell wall biosynthesis
VFDEWTLPTKGYDLAVARAQPDNNLELILDAYACAGANLVFVSNWHSCSFGERLLEKYKRNTNLFLVGPIYSLGKMKALQLGARMYIHGHSAGGTNPSLVEAMWAGLPTVAYDVSFNRHTTENLATYFQSSEELATLLHRVDPGVIAESGQALAAVARRKFRWSNVRASYAELLANPRSTRTKDGRASKSAARATKASPGAATES